MWLKLCLLLIYITILFILARILEAISWYETGALSKRLLDPMTLSVMKLKALLEQRGVSFEGVVLEKSDLTELVEGSGPVTEEDVVMASREEEATSVTNFTSGAHFFEQVEDAKDSVWIIQVSTHQGHPLFLPDSRWKTIRKKVSRFGVRAGILDCRLDNRYCWNKGWVTPRLILALPGSFETKANVHFHTYNGSTRVAPIYNWIREKLDGKVEKITSSKGFARNWSNFSDPLLNPEIRTVLFTDQRTIPMFYSALSVKFPGRVKFGMVNTDSSGGREIMKYMRMRNKTDLSIPTYMVITAEKDVIYGNKHGESLSFPAMESYLKTLYPCLNDIFIVSFLLTNVLTVFEFCLVQGTIYKRLKRFFLYFIKCNIILIMLWLPIVGLFQLPYLDKVPLWLLKVLRTFSTTNMAANLRKDLSFFTFHSSILASVFVAYSVFVGYVEYKRKGGEEENDQDENYWNFTEMRTLEHLISPVDFRNITQPSNMFGAHRLLNPYRPVLSLQYIQDLPRWRCALPVYTHVESDTKTVPCCHCKKDNSTDEFSQKDTKEDLDKSVDDKVIDSSIKHSPCSKTDNDPSRYPDKQPGSEITHEVNPIDKNKCTCEGKQKPEKPMYDCNMPEGYLPSTECVICLEEYKFGVTLCGLPCSHTFHESCVVTWLNRGSHYCPVCRWPAFRLKQCDMQLLSE